MYLRCCPWFMGMLVSQRFGRWQSTARHMGMMPCVVTWYLQRLERQITLWGWLWSTCKISAQQLSVVKLGPIVKLLRELWIHWIIYLEKIVPLIRSLRSVSALFALCLSDSLEAPLLAHFAFTSHQGDPKRLIPISVSWKTIRPMISPKMVSGEMLHRYFYRSRALPQLNVAFLPSFQNARGS